MGIIHNLQKLTQLLFMTGPVPASPPRPAQRATVRSRRDDARRVFDANGQARELAVLLNKGGEGKVYPLAASRDVLVKWYLPHVANGPRAAMIRDKLEAMRANRAMRDSLRFGWPRMLVFDDRQRWIGYAMRRVDGVQLQTLCQPQLVTERLPHWSRREVLVCAMQFVNLVKTAHRNDVILGDINPGNFLIDPQTCEVRGIDCDSYQLRVNGTLFPCPVGVPMLMAPELLDANFSETRRTVEQERFSVAIMLFRMFMLGLHPYSRTYGEDPVANLKSGQCALGVGSGNKLPRGPWYNIWSHLPHYIKAMFIQTFRAGNREPAERVTIEAWEAELQRYLGDMDRGWFDRHMVPKTPKSSQYNGKKENIANDRKSKPLGAYSR